MMLRSHEFVTSNAQRSLRHVASINRNNCTISNRLRQNPVLTMAVNDNNEVSFEREASMAGIHAQLASLRPRIAAIAEAGNFLSQTQGTLATQKSLTNWIIQFPFRRNDRRSQICAILASPAIFLIKGKPGLKCKDYMFRTLTLSYTI